MNVGSDEQLVHRQKRRQGPNQQYKGDHLIFQDDEKSYSRDRNVFFMLLRYAHSINLTLFMSLFFYFFSCAILLYAFRLHKRDLAIQERLVDKLSSIDISGLQATNNKLIPFDKPTDTENKAVIQEEQKQSSGQGQGQAEDFFTVTQWWTQNKPDTGGRQFKQNVIMDQMEFSVAGLFVDVKDALDLKFPMQPDETLTQEVYENGLAQNSKRPVIIDMEQKVRFFIAITTECCTQLARNRRQAIRETWKQDALNKLGNIDIRFILGQPDPEKTDLELLEKKYKEELVGGGGDLLMIRGKDHYRNLRNKTIKLMRFALSSPNKYTHIMKTDDDCYVRMSYILNSIEDKEQDPPVTRMHNVYLGCVENRGGFQPVRDPKSKWYISKEEMSDSVAPWGSRYLSGWGYILSRDVAIFLSQKIDLYEKHPDQQPGWFPAMHWEDVMVGLIVQEMVGEPQPHPSFKPAWRSCTNETAIRHLDVDSPLLLPGLFEQDRSGLWNSKTVQCSSGVFVAGDYWGWLNWRNSLENVAPI